MSEADTPNNQPFPEPTESIDYSAADVSEVEETLQEAPIFSLLELLGSQEDDDDGVEQESSQEPITEPDTAATPLSATIEVGDGLTQVPDASSQEHSKDADWFALTQKMRQRNRRLLDQLTQLKQTLNEKQEALHSQQTRAQERESLLIEQTEELITVKDQLTRMFQTLESSHQAAQRQQILIETLSEQLQSSQERVAQLERECALTQERYNEQSHQLLQSENTCRELKARLHRQQRQALQFKVALEKSLEMPGPSHLSSQPQPPLRSGNAKSALMPKTQPIQPWSAEPELPEDPLKLDSIWYEPTAPDPDSVDSFATQEATEMKNPKESDHAITADASDLAQISAESTARELELEKQLLAEMNSLAEASGLSEFPSDLTDDLDGTPSPERQLDESNEPATFGDDTEESASWSENANLGSEPLNQSQESWREALNSESSEAPEVLLPQSNWPSPVLYPLRPPKKRKSLSAIELPSFPRSQSF